MLNDGIPKKFFSRKNNRDLFYIEFCLDEENGLIYFNSSLPMTAFEDIKSSELIVKLTKLETSTQERHIMIDELIEHVNTFPGIDKYYLSDFLLDINGFYMDYYDKVTNVLLREKDFDDYTVFTPDINGFYFDFAKPILEDELRKNTPIFLDRNTVENLIQKNDALSREYVNIFQGDVKFFASSISQENGYECFVMTSKLEVILFFVRRIN